jgi:hypothetical protein
LLISFVQTSQAAWPLYSTPEFRGRIIDADTKEPIEGAVAVALYDKEMLIGGPGGPNSYVYNAKECLTDKKGEFTFPSYFSLHLISRGDGVRFIFYKPGYMADSGPTKIKPILMEKYFSSGKVGEEMEIEGGTFEQGSYVKWKGPMGIVEMEKGESYPSTPIDYRSAQLPLLFKAINEERRIRGHKGDVE